MSIRVVCTAICLLTLVCLAPTSVTAEGCTERREIKGLPLAARPAVTSTATPSPTVPVVRLALYWAEGCGHCHEVLEGLLPRLQQQYGPQLEVRLIEVVSLEDISAFFDLAEAFSYGRGRASVPFLVIGERALMGVAQIEAELPGLVTAALATGGTEWPAPPAQNAASPAAATTDDTCGFTVPCPEDKTASDAPGSRRLQALAAASALIIALAIGGIVSLRRARGRASAQYLTRNPDADD